MPVVEIRIKRKQIFNTCFKDLLGTSQFQKGVLRVLKGTLDHNSYNEIKMF